ncbi:hypothetical protein WA158_007803 [Blastocystis sp. Blastoise]
MDSPIVIPIYEINDEETLEDACVKGTVINIFPKSDVPNPIILEDHYKNYLICIIQDIQYDKNQNKRQRMVVIFYDSYADLMSQYLHKNDVISISGEAVRFIELPNDHCDNPNILYIHASCKNAESEGSVTILIDSEKQRVLFNNKERPFIQLELKNIQYNPKENYNYISIKNLSAGSRNLFGIVLMASSVISTKGTDLMVRYQIIDPTTSAPSSSLLLSSSLSSFRVNGFFNSFDNTPRVTSIGDIIRIHRLEVLPYRDFFLGTGKKLKTNYIVQSIENDQIYSLSKNYSFSDLDESTFSSYKQWVLNTMAKNDYVLPSLKYYVQLSNTSNMKGIDTIGCVVGIIEDKPNYISYQLYDYSTINTNDVNDTLSKAQPFIASKLSEYIKRLDIHIQDWILLQNVDYLNGEYICNDSTNIMKIPQFFKCIKDIKDTIDKVKLEIGMKNKEQYIYETKLNAMRIKPVTMTRISSTIQCKPEVYTSLYSLNHICNNGVYLSHCQVLDYYPKSIDIINWNDMSNEKIIFFFHVTDGTDISLLFLTEEQFHILTNFKYINKNTQENSDNNTILLDISKLQDRNVFCDFLIRRCQNKQRTSLYIVDSCFL